MRITEMMVALALVASPNVAWSHNVAKGPNGGQIVDDKGHHVEFTTKGSEVVLYLSDDKDKPIGSMGASGRVVIQAAGKQASVALVPADPNMLTAKLEGPLAAGAKLVVSAKLPDGHDLQARFVVK